MTIPGAQVSSRGSSWKTWFRRIFRGPEGTDVQKRIQLKPGQNQEAKDLY